MDDRTSRVIVCAAGGSFWGGIIGGLCLSLFPNMPVLLVVFIGGIIGGVFGFLAA